MGWLLALGGAAFLAVLVGVVGYTGWCMGALPAGNPAEVLAEGPPPADHPVLVCLGDSITQGVLGADWVGGLRERLGDDALVVNAGVGGQLTWDLRQRLDEVGRCCPHAIVLLVGSNDAVGSLGGQWASFYEKGRPQAPSEDWFAEQYGALVAELVAMAPRLVCLTLPPLGEDASGQAAAIVRRQNEAIRATAATHDIDVLDIHPAFLRLRPEAPRGSGVPFLGGLSPFMAWSTASILRHRLLGQSWDRIARSRGLVLTADTIHPSDRGADAMLALVEPWARGALGLTASPGRHEPPLNTEQT